MLARNNADDLRPTFVLNEDDEAMWSRDDIVKKLPTPILAGTSRRVQFQFRCNVDKWDLQYVLNVSAEVAGVN